VIELKFLKAGRVLGITAVAAMTTLSACGPSKPVVSAPPPPPPVVVPLKPYPPLGASTTLVPPPVLPNGMHQTVNSTISTAQTTWNLRSAYNVAALNCQSPQHAAILTGYRQFLKSQAKPLTAANKAVDNEFKARNGAKFIGPRETYMTQVYNFYALPPTLPTFCDAALQMSAEAQTVKPAELDAFAARSLPRLDGVFETFYRSYDQYRADLTAWESRYGSLIGVRTSAAPIQGPVAASQ
jgi:hypothetical protein